MISSSQMMVMRHGKTEAGSVYIGSTDAVLNELGWQQMQQSIDECLVGDVFPWDLIVTSPLQRCQQFAQALAMRFSLPLEIDPQLSEYHFGVWEGMSALAVMERYPNALERFWEDPQQYPPQQGERLDDFASRLDSAITALIERSRSQRIFIICHGGVIRYIKCRQSGKPLAQMLSFEIGHGQCELVDCEAFIMRGATV